VEEGVGIVGVVGMVGVALEVVKGAVKAVVNWGPHTLQLQMLQVGIASS